MAAVKKEIKIDGKIVKMKCSADTPRAYRIRFRRDILKDLNSLSKTQDSEEEFNLNDLSVFENIAYIMAKQGDPDNVPDSMDDWLDGFNVFSIYEVFPVIMEMWGYNTETEVEAEKN